MPAYIGAAEQHRAHSKREIRKSDEKNKRKSKKEEEQLRCVECVSLVVLYFITQRKSEMESRLYLAHRRFVVHVTQYKRREQGRKHMLRTIAARQRTALTVHSIQLFVCCFFFFIFFVECLYRVVRMHDFNFERDICSN